MGPSLIIESDTRLLSEPKFQYYCYRAEQSNASIVSLGLPSIQLFNASGDPSNLSQRWCKWKKSFEYFLLASGINDEKRKRALLSHLIGADTQEIFETFSNTGEDYETAMVKLDDYFDHKKTFLFNVINVVRLNRNLVSR